MLQFDGVVVNDLTDHTIWIERADMVEDSTASIAEFYNQYPGKGGERWVLYTISKNAAAEIISVAISSSSTKPSFVP